MDNFKQTKQWEEIFKKIVDKAMKCPAIQLCSNYLITPETIDNAAGNHVFDDNPNFWGITENEAHQIRAVFQTHSVRYNSEFKNYIQDLINSSFTFG